MTFRVHDTLDLRIPRDPLTHIYASVSLQDETDLLHILTPPIHSVNFPRVQAWPTPVSGLGIPVITVKGTVSRHYGDIPCAPIPGNVLGGTFGCQTCVNPVTNRGQRCLNAGYCVLRNLLFLL